MKHDISSPVPRWSPATTTGPDPVERFKAQLKTLLSHRLKRGETIDDTETRSILAAASAALAEGKIR